MHFKVAITSKGPANMASRMKIRNYSLEYVKLGHKL